MMRTQTTLHAPGGQRPADGPPPEDTTRRRYRGLCATLALCALGLVGCANVNDAFDPAKPHHRPDGFVNPSPAREGEENPSFLRWQWERWRADLPADQPGRVPRAEPQTDYLRDNRSDLSFTWLGHSSALWQVAGLNVLTDPHLGERASPVSFAGPRRLTPAPLRVDQLPRIDIVLISHNHYDHLDADTVRALAAQPGGPPLFLVPLGVEKWLADEGITHTRRMDWWDRFDTAGPAGSVSVHFVPAHHWSSRTPWDRRATLWGGFVVQVSAPGGPFSLYYAGDTGYAPDFAEIGRRFGGFDIAMIPVGCYLPRWFMQNQHVNEEEAVKIHQDVKSRQSIGVHWGTFRLCDDPIDAPVDGLPAALSRLGVPAGQFVLPVLGQTRVLRPARP